MALNSNNDLTNLTNLSTDGATITPVKAVAASSTITALDSSKSFVRISGTIAFNVVGISAGIDGQKIEIYNATGQNMTITPSSGSAASADQILIMTTAASIVTTGRGYASLIYSSTDAKWLCKYVST
jgi:hypothetical protein